MDGDGGENECGSLNLFQCVFDWVLVDFCWFMGFKCSPRVVQNLRSQKSQWQIQQLIAYQTQTPHRYQASSATAKDRATGIPTSQPFRCKVGDQQQLPHPVSQKLATTKAGGMSCLEYFTQGAACIDNRCGLFLPTTYRMSAQLTQVPLRKPTDVTKLFYERHIKTYWYQCPAKSTGRRIQISTDA